MDVPLRNRTYTWSSKRPVPSFSRLDRVFTSPEWAEEYPVITLEALEVLVSDHTPLILTCKGLESRRRVYKLETFWFKYDTPKAMVQQLWQGGYSQRTQLESFTGKLQSCIEP